VANYLYSTRHLTLTYGGPINMARIETARPDLVLDDLVPRCGIHLVAKRSMFVKELLSEMYSSIPAPIYLSPDRQQRRNRSL